MAMYMYSTITSIVFFFSTNNQHGDWSTTYLGFFFMSLVPFYGLKIILWSNLLLPASEQKLLMPKMTFSPTPPMKGDSFVLLKQTSLSLSVFLVENILRRMEKILGLCCKRQYRTGQIKSVLIQIWQEFMSMEFWTPWLPESWNPQFCPHYSALLGL